MHTVIQTDRHTDIQTFLQTYLHAKTVGPEKSFKAGLGAMETACSAMASPAKIDVTGKSPVGDISCHTDKNRYYT